MLKIGTEHKYEQPHSGPHGIIKVNNNRTVRLQMGVVIDTVNIRRIDPYRDTSSSIHGGSAVCQSPALEQIAERLRVRDSILSFLEDSY